MKSVAGMTYYYGMCVCGGRVLTCHWMIELHLCLNVGIFIFGLDLDFTRIRFFFCVSV